MIMTIEKWANETVKTDSLAELALLLTQLTGSSITDLRS